MSDSKSCEVPLHTIPANHRGVLYNNIPHLFSIAIGKEILAEEWLHTAPRALGIIRTQAGLSRGVWAVVSCRTDDTLGLAGVDLVVAT